MKNLDPREVLYIYSHLAITLAIIVLYGALAFTGKEDQTLQMVLIAAVSFWFGSMGKPVAANQTNIQHANEVKTSETKKEGE